MAGKGYLRGLLLALIWFALLFAALYVAAWFAAEPPNMRLFCMIMIAAWPPCAGFYGGWREGEAGFGAGARQAVIPVLLIAVLWWWLIPALWDGWLMGKFALYALATAMLAGGLGAGFKKARQTLYPPPPDHPEDDEEPIE